MRAGLTAQRRSSDKFQLQVRVRARVRIRVRAMPPAQLSHMPQLLQTGGYLCGLESQVMQGGLV